MKTSIYLLIVTILVSFQSLAQCNRSGTLQGTFNVTGTTCGTFSSINSYNPGRYFRLPVYTGGSYTVQTCDNTMNTQITAYQPPNTTAGTHFAYNDDNGPICGAGSQRASVILTPTFTGFAEVMVNEFNCLAGGSAITVGYRQNNNLSFSGAFPEVCVGDVLPLSATPLRSATFQAGAGDQGTFSGTGVSGTNFTAPAIAGASQSFDITYTFGVCSIVQAVIVRAPPSASNAGPDQTILTTSTTLAANTPAIGSGSWSIISGPGTVTNTLDPASTITGLVAGNTTVLRWTVFNGISCPSETDDVNIHASSGLPIELVGFNALVRENSRVELLWETASESNNDFFTVERSKNAKDWVEVGKIQGAGTSTTTLQYSTVDYNAKSGIWYYRLKQTDFDGMYAYSGIRTVEIFPMIQEMKIYPNPAENYVNVEGSPVEIETVRLFDIQGKEVSVERLCDGGKCKLILDGLKSGMYMIRSRNHVFRILKK